MEYKEMYYSLFNAVTDAIEQIQEQNFGIASQTLIQAQIKCEELYINQDADKESSD